MSYEHVFNRFELKYVLHYDEAMSFVEQILDFIFPDPYAGEDGIYRVSSLYYDTDDYLFYWEKIDGIKFRRKLRVRRYLDSNNNNVSLEIKQRIDRTIQKRRIILPLEQVFSLIPFPETWSPPDKDAANDSPVVVEAQYLVARYDLKPKIMISYNRRAYHAFYDRGLRITIDSNLKCRCHNLDWSIPDEEDAYFLPAEYRILEIKFNETVPRWLTSYIGYFECELRRISKYCQGIDTLVFHGA